MPQRDIPDAFARTLGYPRPHPAFLAFWWSRWTGRLGVTRTATHEHRPSVHVLRPMSAFYIDRRFAKTGHFRRDRDFAREIHARGVTSSPGSVVRCALGWRSREGKESPHVGEIL